MREWGAWCDVVAVQPQPNASPPATATWDPTLQDPNNRSFHGALVVTTSLLKPPPNPTSGLPYYIAISQVGGPTLWMNGTGIAPPAMWATRFSSLSAKGSHYRPGDLVSFIDTTTTAFSQQIAIIVDSIGASGSIDKWHFLWGGLYDATAVTDSTFGQDPVAAHNYLQNNGSGAQLTPAWSGWSLLNTQAIAVAGNNYGVGDTITFSENMMGTGTMDGSTVNQGQYPTLLVESIGPGGVVLSYDWLDYGSYKVLPSSPMLLSSVVTNTATGAHGGGMGFKLGPVQWTRGPLATTIDYVQQDADPLKTDIFVSENFSAYPDNAFPTIMPVQFFYYGHDDGGAITNALKSQSALGIATGSAAAFRLPAACGATTPINLPQDSSPNSVNPALIGGNFQSTGLYAFAAPLGGRLTTPVLSRVLYGGLAATNGGGFRDMLIEAMGIPEGFGYYGFAQSAAPPGRIGAYVGPPARTSATPTPTAGDAVEIDSAKYLRIRNVHVSDGGLGSGNSNFQCGIDESDPSGLLGGNAVGNLVVSDSRFDANPLFSGATNPDVSLRLGNTCHDSVYRNLVVYDGTKADLLEYNGNVFSQIRLGSDAVTNNAPPDPGLMLTAANSGFAGVADYGAYIVQNTSLAQTRCDVANRACILMGADSTSSYHNPGQITDTQVRCGVLPSVPPAYQGVELGGGAANLTVGGTAAFGPCHMPSAQLVAVDGPPSATVSLCGNSSGLGAFCAGYPGGFAPGRWYTQPALGYTPTSSGVSLQGAASLPTSLYAVPFINPAGGAITQMGLQVTAPGTGAGAATQCELGVYGSSAGAPGALLLDGGPVPVTSAGPETLGSLNLLLQPNTLYFLAVGCNGTVSVQGTAGTTGFIGLLLGEAGFTAYGATSVSTSWSAFAPRGLPATFGPASYGATEVATTAPNIYVGR